jgi:hypothetical protein
MHSREYLQQAICAAILIPFIFIYSLLEIRRGWLIIKHKKPMLNFIYWVRITFIKSVMGKDEAEKYEESIKNDPRKIRRSAWYSLIGGILGVVVSFFWIYAYFIF